ncbi:MAG: DUF2281 domain-containing protein [Methanosarcinales archaeon]|nr:MAG: DUF2281 domain-containing protein [Methanosarcinales archaeon]
MQTNSKAEIFEQIVKGIQTFPYQMQVEVLDFISFLKNKLAIEQARNEEVEWSYLSISNALKDIDYENEEEYSEADLKEKWL